MSDIEHLVKSSRDLKLKSVSTNMKGNTKQFKVDSIEKNKKLSRHSAPLALNEPNKEADRLLKRKSLPARQLNEKLSRK